MCRTDYVVAGKGLDENWVRAEQRAIKSGGYLFNSLPTHNHVTSYFGRLQIHFNRNDLNGKHFFFGTSKPQPFNTKIDAHE